MKNLQLMHCWVVALWIANGLQLAHVIPLAVYEHDEHSAGHGEHLDDDDA